MMYGQQPMYGQATTSNDLMWIHNLRCSVQLIKIEKWDKKIFEKNVVHDSGAANNFVRVIVTYAIVAFAYFILWRKRIRFAGHSIWTNQTRLGRWKNLTNDSYSDIYIAVFGLGVFGMARRHALVSLRHAAPSQCQTAPFLFFFKFFFKDCYYNLEKRWQARQILWLRVAPMPTSPLPM